MRLVALKLHNKMWILAKATSTRALQLKCFKQLGTKWSANKLDEEKIRNGQENSPWTALNLIRFGLCKLSILFVCQAKPFLFPIQTGFLENFI